MKTPELDKITNTASDVALKRVSRITRLGGLGFCALVSLSAFNNAFVFINDREAMMINPLSGNIVQYFCAVLA
jgi:hypothetical protein